MDAIGGKNNLIYPELSYKITGLLFTTQNELGRYCREIQYGNFLENLLRINQIKFKRENRVGNSGNILDFIVENKIVLELKAKSNIIKEDYYQIQRYLQITGLKLGLLVNFRNRFLKPIRVIKIETTNKKRFV